MSNLMDQLLPKQNLFEQVCDIDQLRLGFKAVKKNRGAPGIDGVTVEAYANKLEEELERLSQDLSSWSYKPKPVRRVEIPKLGKCAGTRLLGIPCVRDRVVQATLKNLLEPILDPKFSDSSYGFRPGRNQKQAGHSGQIFYRIALGSAGEWHAALQALEVAPVALHDTPLRSRERFGRSSARSSLPASDCAPRRCSE